VVETIFKGATRPPTKWGVPLVMLVLVIMPLGLLSMYLFILVNWRAGLVAIVVAAAVYAWMRWITSKDDQRLLQTLLKIRLAWRNPNRVLRGGIRSYAPISCKGGRDAWRR
jgi:type IV secretory pathway VirB3-like protein